MPTVIKEKLGFWSPRTASIDWCEENYVLTPWVAEFWNTVSNISMILPPMYGLYSSYKLGLERRYVYSYLIFLLVGIGSTMFHMTLRYPMQLLDELPMIYCTCTFIYSLSLIKAGPGKQNRLLMLGLFLYSMAFTFMYSVFTNPLFHEVMYGVLVTVLLFQVSYLVYKEDHPTSRRLYTIGTCMYALAFLFWNIDNNFCPQLQSFREKVSYPVGVFSEFHAWWHILVGYSTYMHIVFSSHHRLYQLRRNPVIGTCPVGICVVKS